MHIAAANDSSTSSTSSHIDIFLSHDWPNRIWEYGNVTELLQIKPYFQKDISSGSLGSIPGMMLLKALKPSFWFAGHMHVKFAAVVPHTNSNNRMVDTIDTNAIDLDNDHQQYPIKTVTRFLALDKVIPGR